MSSFSSFPPEEDDDVRTKTFTLDDLLESVAPASREKRAALYCLTGRLMGKVFHLQDDETEFGRDAKDYRISDEGVSRHHALIRRVGRDYILTDLGSTNGTICNGRRVREPVLLREGDEIRMGPVATFRFEFHDELDEQVRQRLYELATRDSLTGLLNRRAFLETLEAEQAWCRRHKHPAALLWFDIDHFKHINDTYGHPAGDEVLRRLGRLLRQEVRREDNVGRVGGEEFGALGRGLNQEQALRFAERLRTRVEQESFPWSNETIPVTISIGVAACPQDRDLSSSEVVSTWISRADQALYKAKQSGRNRVEFYVPQESSAPPESER